MTPINSPNNTTLYVFLSSMLVVMIAEFPCAIRSAILDIQYNKLWPIFWGTMIGTAITIGIGLVVGEAVSRYIPPHSIKWVAGSVFVVLGLLIMSGRME